MSLAPALDGERRELTGRSGRLSYYTRGSGPPLLLVHSVNAAASAFEMKPIFDALSTDRCVYAVDLPGFGFSSREARDYNVELFCLAVEDMLGEIRACSGSASIDVVALSLGSEFVARAIQRSPEAWRTLTLITPTGFSWRYEPSDDVETGTFEIKTMSSLLKLPLIGRSLFVPLTTRASIRYFMRRTYGSQDVDESLVDYAYETASEPGAHHAPLAFLSGCLFSRDIVRVYQSLNLPVWVPHATRGDFKDFSVTNWADRSAHWKLEPFSSGAMPHFECSSQFLTSQRAFLAGGGA